MRTQHQINLHRNRESEEWLNVNSQYFKFKLYRINTDNKHECQDNNCKNCKATTFKTHGYCEICDGCNKSFSKGSATSKIKHLWHGTAHADTRQFLALSDFILIVFRLIPRSILFYCLNKD